MTSSGVVVRLRRILNQKKIGHTGTLDPMAEGVLPVCAGKAARLSDYIMDKDKEYIAELTLGAETDTEDSTGNVISRSDKIVTSGELKETLKDFTGELIQTPPMYSAVKIAGKKLYEYARQGQIVQRAPRRITVYGLELLEQTGQNRFRLRIHCSKGTYVRTICADIGKTLGAGGHMSALSRVRAGCYDISSAFTLGDIEKMAETGDYSFVRPMDEPLLQFKRADIKPEFAAKFLNGGALEPHMYIAEDLYAGDKIRVYLNGVFSALSVFDGQALKIICLLAGQS